MWREPKPAPGLDEHRVRQVVRQRVRAASSPARGCRAPRRSRCASYLSSVRRTTSGAGRRTSAPSSSVRRSASSRWSRSASGTISRTPCSRTSSCERGEVAGIVDARNDRALVRVVERGRERVGVDRDRVRAGAAKRGDDVDALPGAGEEDGGHGRNRLAARLQPPVAALVRAAEQGERRAREDLQVDLRRAVLDVPDVQLDPLLPGQRRAAVDLRPAGDPRLDLEPPPLARRVPLDLVARASAAGRSRSCRRGRRSRAGAARRSRAAGGAGRRA